MSSSHFNPIAETLEYTIGLPDLNPLSLYTKILRVASRGLIHKREELEPFQSFAFNPFLYPLILTPYLNDFTRESLTMTVNWLLAIGKHDLRIELSQTRSFGGLTPTFDVRIIVLDNPQSENRYDNTLQEK